MLGDLAGIGGRRQLPVRQLARLEQALRIAPPVTELSENSVEWTRLGQLATEALEGHTYRAGSSTAGDLAARFAALGGDAEAASLRRGGPERGDRYLTLDPALRDEPLAAEGRWNASGHRSSSSAPRARVAGGAAHRTRASPARPRGGALPSAGARTSDPGVRRSGSETSRPQGRGPRARG